MVKARLLASIIDLWHCIGLLALLTSFLLGIGKVPEGLALPRARNDLMKEFIKLLIHLFQHIPTIDAPSATDDILYLARVELEACTIGISYLYHSNLVPIVL